jgi:hypothetical protein
VEGALGSWGRSERRGGIDSFDRLVWQMMMKEPYASARRLFWIVDNGSAHVHLRIHASRLNQGGDLLLDPPAQGANPE